MSVNLKFSFGDKDMGRYYVPMDMDICWIACHNLFEDHLFEVTDNIIKKIQSPNQIVVVWGAYARLGTSHNIIQHFENFAESIPNPLVLINGDYSTKQITVKNFVYGEVAYFQHDARGVWERHRIGLPLNRTRKFLMMSTKNYPTRRYLLSQILDKRLDAQGYVSYSCLNDGNISEGNYTRAQIDRVLEVADRINHLLPLPYLDDTLEWSLMPKEFLLNSYINMVTETFFEGGLFISEKPYTAIAHGQMFVMLAAPGALAYLRGQGYQTFGAWWDESYDTITDNYDRLVAVSKTFMDLVQRPIEELATIYTQAKSVIEHNRRHFFAQDTNADFVALLQQARQLKNG
jgi:hypothetical protein